MTLHILQARSGKTLLTLVTVSLTLLTFVALGQGQVNSRSATVTLTAVLSQSLRVSASPDGAVLSSFLPSQQGPALPVTFNVNWVRGPGQVSISTFVSGAYESGPEDRGVVLERRAVPGQNALEVDTRELQLPTGANQVLTIRAQAI
jgi:hypothetical protein